jgi:hypothetical protein
MLSRYSQEPSLYVPAAVTSVLTAAESITKPAVGTEFTAVGTTVAVIRPK